MSKCNSCDLDISPSQYTIIWGHVQYMTKRHAAYENSVINSYSSQDYERKPGLPTDGQTHRPTLEKQYVPSSWKNNSQSKLSK